MSLWDRLPASVRNGGGADGLRPVLEAVDVEELPDLTDADGTWRRAKATAGGDDPLYVDPAGAGFSRSVPSGPTPIEFPDPDVEVELRLHLDAAGDPDGWCKVIVATPEAIVRIRELRGARLDAQGQLRPDPSNPVVRFLLPALRIEFERPAGGAISVELLSASTGTSVGHIYDFVRMEPPYALIGPGEAVGFGFRAAVLDLAGTAGPAGVPAGARTMPDEWQGLWLPEVRLFVSPSGMEGLAVSAGVRDLWIGIGAHAGVTGIFEAEVVDRGSAPDVRLRLQTPTGEWIGVPDGAAPATVDAPTGSRLYADAGGGLAPHRYEITVDGVTTATDRVVVNPPATGSLSVEVRVHDAAAHTTARNLSVTRRVDTPVTPPSGLAVTARTTSGHGSAVVLAGQTATDVTVRLQPAGGDVQWAWPGGSAFGAEATIPVASGAPVTVTATRTSTSTDQAEVAAYTLFDRPELRPPDQLAAHIAAFAGNVDNTHTQPASDRAGWGSSPTFLATDGTWPQAATYPGGTTWTVEGYASFEGDDRPAEQDYNRELSERRRDVLVSILEANGFAGQVTAGAAHGHTEARDSTTVPPGSPSWWRAVATATIPTTATETVTAELERPAATPPDPDPQPTRPPTPDCFRRIGARVELLRGTFIRAEIHGEFDVYTATEQRLAASSPAPLPARSNPSDGICTFLLRLRIAEDRSSWDVTAEFRAVEGDLDGLARVDGSGTGLNILGAVAALSPLLATATPPSPNAGELVPMVVASGVAVGLGASGVMETKAVILRGGELVVTDGLIDPTTGSGPRRTQVSVLLDVETAFTFDLGFISVDPAKPVTARYKAVGIRSTWDTVDDGSGDVEFVPLPVFDPSEGFSLDVPAGSLAAADPLGDILRVLGMRVSRDNPAFLEVEVGMGVDLGILQVDTARVRLRLDAVEAPELTKLGASLEIPGTLVGSGYVEITDAGFKGALDLTVVPLNIRARAVLAVESQHGVTGVLVGIDVEFPVPLVLGNSGLGIYGLLGGSGINYARREVGGTAPALRWLEQQLPRPGGVMDPTGWEHRAGSYAVAAGALLGTLEGGFVLHLKGVVLIEVPGPRLLIVMKADVLSLPPVLDSTQSATFLAVLDLDFARGTITVGIVAEYSVHQLIHIRVPVVAFFDTNDVSHWFVDLGSFHDPVSVRVLDLFTGIGYVMIHGDGITDHPNPALRSSSTALTVAVGFHLQCVLMGSRSAGLYLEVAAGFDALVALEPFYLAGQIYARGELRLFIVSVSASAALTVKAGRHVSDGTEVDRTYVHGEVCGKVDFFFFSVEGCVSLTIGSEPSPPVPSSLVAGVSLVSRSPALLEGTATDRVVDGKLADAVAAGSSTALPTVPLDSVPVVLFEAAPSATGASVLGGTAQASSGVGGNPWVRRGDRWWRYELVSVDLEGPLLPATGEKPATWWLRSGTPDPAQGPALALLNWLPTPTPRALPYGDRLTSTVTERWSGVCRETAPATPVLWTFEREPVGPSQPGWDVDGVAWPDPPDATRTSPVRAVLEVRELWRTGDPFADLLSGIDPAAVVGDAVRCFAGKRPVAVNGLGHWADRGEEGFSNDAQLSLVGTADALVDLVADGTPLSDVAAAWVATTWDPDLDPEKGATCHGRILRSPLHDTGTPAPLGSRDDRRLVDRTWSELGFEPSELADTVRLGTEGGFRSLVLLLLAPLERVHGELLWVRYLGPEGAEISRQPVTGGDQVRPGRPLPSRWTDPGGPWAASIDHAGQTAGRLTGDRRDLALFLVDCEVPDPEATVEVGWLRVDDDRDRTFYVVAAEGVGEAEFVRHHSESTSREDDREALENALTQDPDDHALLSPGATYTVVVKWKAESSDQEDRPAATTAPIAGAANTERFRFQADPAAEAPADLAPWLLATAPAMGEVGYLTAEPVRIALATQNVAALFAAYGEELRVIVRAASGDHPLAPGPTPGHVVIPSALGGVAVEGPAGLSVMTPWEQAVREVVDGLHCVEAGGERRHTVIEIDYAFEPLTDYLLDIVAVPLGAPAGASGRRVHRIGFTTSRFAVAQDIADLVAGAVVRQRSVENPAALAALVARPTGQQLDEAFQAAGLGVPTVPRYPQVEVLWSLDPTPQPVAVIIECSEAMWRSRPMPTEVSGPATGGDPGHTWWRAEPQDWLLLDTTPAPTGTGDLPAAPVSRVIRGPGDTRAIVLLAAGARGTVVRLDLRHVGDALAETPTTSHRVVDLALRSAPWEEA